MIPQSRGREEGSGVQDYLDCTESWGDWESTFLSVSEGTLGKSFGGTFAVPEGGASSAGLMSTLAKDPVLLDEGKLAERP